MNKKGAGRPPKKVNEHDSNIPLVEKKDSRLEVVLPYVVNFGTVMECIIVRGSFHQGDSRFGEQRGVQCMAISCVALCFTLTKPIWTWKT